VNVQIIPDTGKRSVKLSKDELKKLRSYRGGFDTAIECANTIDILRPTLDRVLLTGSGSPETIYKIRTVVIEGVEEKRESKV
jgi:hypothetical protein